MLIELKMLWDAREHLMWREWIDGIAHAIKIPYRIQTRLCDWVDNSYYN